MTYIRWPKVKLHVSLILILVINLITDNFLYLIPFTICFLIHELGHIIIIYLNKGKIQEIEINAFGAMISTNLHNNILVDFGRHHCKYYYMFV